VSNVFKKFFGQEDLLDRFNLKADKRYVEELDSTKATRADIHNLSLTIEAVYQRIVHISIL